MNSHLNLLALNEYSIYMSQPKLLA